MGLWPRPLTCACCRCQSKLEYNYHNRDAGLPPDSVLTRPISFEDLKQHSLRDEYEAIAPLTELRTSMGFHLAVLAVKHGIDVDESLVDLLPPAGDEEKREGNT